MLLLLALTVVELADLDFFNVLISRVLQDYELVSDDSVGYFLFLGRIQLVGVGYLMDLHFAPILHVLVLVQDLGNVYFLFTAGILIVGAHGS